MHRKFRSFEGNSGVTDMLKEIRGRHFLFGARAMALSFMIFVSGALAAANLSGNQIRSLISGKVVYLATPFGGELPLTYHVNGGLDGEAKGIVKLVQKSDTGKWWISGDRMCQKWHSWYNGKTYCFNLQMEGAGKFKWLRDDGASGEGRVGS